MAEILLSTISLLIIAVGYLLIYICVLCALIFYELNIKGETKILKELLNIFKKEATL